VVGINVGFGTVGDSVGRSVDNAGCIVGGGNDGAGNRSVGLNVGMAVPDPLGAEVGANVSAVGSHVKPVVFLKGLPLGKPTKASRRLWFSCAVNEAQITACTSSLLGCTTESAAKTVINSYPMLKGSVPFVIALQDILSSFINGAPI
jgi:hypothetical protein